MYLRRAKRNEPSHCRTSTLDANRGCRPSDATARGASRLSWVSKASLGRLLVGLLASQMKEKRRYQPFRNSRGVLPKAILND
jgi:hypothetical protein